MQDSLTWAPLEYDRKMVQNLPCPEVSLEKQREIDQLPTTKIEIYSTILHDIKQLVLHLYR